jgi:hypothetical protein
MKKRMGGFVSGFVTAILVLGLAIPAFAAYQKQATLNYNDIKVTMDGNAITPKDANGNAIEPFIIDGTTYLPVRGIATALNLNVGWDQATSTVTLSSKESGSQASAGTVLVEKNGIKITYTGVDYGGTFGPEVKLLIENNASKTYTVQVRECSVNGYMIDPTFSPEVAAGKKINDELSFRKSDFEKNGVSSIQTIELYFHIFDSATWDDSFDTAKVTINCN